jgi:hypothetical protein
MKSEMMREFRKVRNKSVALGKKLSSKDPEVAKKAEVQLGEIAREFHAWAKKYKVKLVRHVEEPPTAEPMRRCKEVIFTKVNGIDMGCVLIGRQGRKCLYDCAPDTGTYPPSWL